MANGSLADFRIINSSKSYNAAVFYYLKFPIDAQYEKLKMFHEALESFIRNRPREWICFDDFRATDVNASLGYIEYLVSVVHRESWAQWSQIRISQSDLMRFGVELSKKLNLTYSQPTLPIDIRLNRQLAHNLTASVMGESEVPPGSEVSKESQEYPFNTQVWSTTQGSVGSSYSNEFQSIAARFPPRLPRAKQRKSVA